MATLVLGSVAPLAGTTAFAAEQGTITIKDTQKDQTYTAFKLFDATVNGDAVSYTLPDGNLFDTLKQNGVETHFTVTKNGTLNYFTLKQDDAAGKEAMIKWAQGFKDKLPDGKKVTEDTDDKTATLDVDYGYYIVTSTYNNGSVVMVTSNTPNATIREKNSNNPGWGDNGGKKVGAKTYNIGDKITYTVTYEKATNYNTKDTGTGKVTEKVYQYVLHDDMPDGAVVLDESSIEVKVNNVKVDPKNVDNTKGYTFAKDQMNTNDFTITIPWAETQEAKQNGDDEDFFYNGISKIEITYTGVLKEAAVEGSTTGNANTARIQPNVTPNPSDPKDPGKTAKVYDGEINIKKVDGQNENITLEGAVFVLQNDKKEYYTYDANKQETTWGNDLTKATKVTTGTNGTAKFSGIAEGTYHLVEIEAPKGYNLLDAPTDVTLELKEGAAADADTLLATPKVANNKGAELPSTGSTGTKLFYTVGAVLLVSAGVALVARRRVED
ncbi:SpaH/EbpB family LPXTG-anchored major pilin [Streptococcus ovis]|uniref:SpaH/EbpB family LPXTG-anchored major pilin n=1 Tax=Streptococcus ovis TaxID=82806 RepID=UPI00039C8050|nr:SpaH/EbpB family LPXTG-anchored major pilin [Streptococcus ovis]